MADPKANEALPFHHYSLKHRVISWVSLHMFDNLVYTVRHGNLKGMKRKGGLGWMPARLSPTVVTAEQQFWADIDLRGLVVYDIGAFQGLLTLFFARLAKSVVCFEPNTHNHKRLMENLRLNGITNVDVRKVGVGSQGETRKMVGDPLMMGGSSVDGMAAEHMSRAGVAPVVEEINMVALDEEIARANLPAPNFVKIDIEGWEIEALRGGRQILTLYKPQLFLEMHGETMLEKRRKVAEIVDFLWELNYRRILHVETGTAITPENSDVAARGHLFCQTV